MFPRRYVSIVCTTIVGFAACWFVPGSKVERYAFLVSIMPFTGKEAVIDGNGTAEKPYAHKTSKPIDLEKVSQPIDISITDDPNQIFQESPPSPLDYAIILKNLQRLKQDSIAIGVPLTWDNPEAIPLTALDQQLNAVPNLITSAPLSRGLVPSAIPPAFRRGSIALSQVHGNKALVPIVNRIPIPDVILGHGKSLAGFTTLESEPDRNSMPLIAIWDDRVVLSFHLLAALNHLQVSPDSIQVHLGKHIYLGKRSHFIPIDTSGRLSLFPKAFKTIKSKPYPAENLLDATEQNFPKNDFKPVVIRNAHSAQDAIAHDFSESLIPSVTLLSNPVDSFSVRYYGYLTKDVEFLFMAALLSFIFCLQNFFLGRDARIPILLLMIILIITHFVVVYYAATWIPTLQALATLTVALYFTRRKTNQYRRGRFQLPW